MRNADIVFNAQARSGWVRRLALNASRALGCYVIAQAVQREGAIMSVGGDMGTLGLFEGA